MNHATIQRLRRIPWRKFSILLLPLCLLSLALAGQQVLPIQVQFDQRVELTAIIFYLAGNKEYAECHDAAYVQAVDDFFHKSRSHPAVKMAADLRERKHIWFGSPMSFAVHLTPGLRLLPGTKDQASGGSLDFRWNLVEAQRFAQEVRSFARASKAQNFFQQHEPLYRRMTRRLAQLTSQVHPEWFASLTRTKTARQFTVIPSLLLGNGNYGPHVQTKAGIHNYAIMGVWKSEKDGSPAFGKDSEWIIIHEFAHSYVNPWIDQGIAQLRPAGEMLIKARQHDFDKTGYGDGGKFNPDMLYETMVRALVVLYFADNGDLVSAQQRLQEDVQHGWTWVPAVVDWIKAARTNGSFQLDEATRKEYANLLIASAQK